MELHEDAARFAQEVQDTLSAVLPGDYQIVSVAREGRYVVRPDGATAAQQHIPLYVGSDRLASLSVQIYLGLDSSGRYLKAWKSNVAVLSTLDRRPLIRQEFDATMSENAPVAHWHVHAERGALSHLLGRAHAVDSSKVSKPHEMSSLHFPVGGERFRPCLEDVLEFLIREWGVDHFEGWKAALYEGRQRWRRMQFRSTVRDLQAEAADVLRAHGWTVTAPDGEVSEGGGALYRW